MRYFLSQKAAISSVDKPNKALFVKITGKFGFIPETIRLTNSQEIVSIPSTGKCTCTLTLSDIMFHCGVGYCWPAGY